MSKVMTYFFWNEKYFYLPKALFKNRSGELILDLDSKYQTMVRTYQLTLMECHNLDNWMGLLKSMGWRFKPNKKFPEQTIAYFKGSTVWKITITNIVSIRKTSIMFGHQAGSESRPSPVYLNLIIDNLTKDVYVHKSICIRPEVIKNSHVVLKPELSLAGDRYTYRLYHHPNGVYLHGQLFTKNPYAMVRFAKNSGSKMMKIIWDCENDLNDLSDLLYQTSSETIMNSNNHRNLHNEKSIEKYIQTLCL